MDSRDLGPLEGAALLGLALAEGSASSPLSIAGLHRLLPGYRTQLGNLRAAVADRGLVSSRLVQGPSGLALPGAESLLEDWVRRQGMARRCWEEVADEVLGLCKLPWVEGVALSGALAWGGVNRAEDPVSLVVLCEGGRCSSALRGIEAYRLLKGRNIRIEGLIDADRLSLSPSGTVGALQILALRPVANHEGFAALWAANPWVLEHFPNACPEDDGERQSFLRSGRIDGKLAQLRRRLVQTSGKGGPLLRSADRRKLPRIGGSWGSEVSLPPWPSLDACERLLVEAKARVDTVLAGLGESQRTRPGVQRKDVALEEPSNASVVVAAGAVTAEKNQGGQAEVAESGRNPIFAGRSELGQRTAGSGRKLGGRRRTPRRRPQ